MTWKVSEINIVPKVSGDSGSSEFYSNKISEERICKSVFLRKLVSSNFCIRKLVENNITRFDIKQSAVKFSNFFIFFVGVFLSKDKGVKNAKKRYTVVKLMASEDVSVGVSQTLLVELYLS